MASELIVEPSASESCKTLHQEDPLQQSFYSSPSSSAPDGTVPADLATSSAPPCGLSPQRVQSLPRAWERRPATPHVPRNDAQKIWKRVPLGVVGTAEGQRWRKETSTVNTRPLKRLRVKHLGDEEEGDKENVDYAGSKWEGEGMATPSPKRKGKAVECGVRSHLEGVEGQNILGPGTDDACDEGDSSEVLNEITAASSSPEQGNFSVFKPVEELRTAEDEDAFPPGGSDAFPPTEPKSPDTSPMGIVHSTKSHSPTAMPSLGQGRYPPLPVDDGCCIEAAPETDGLPDEYTPQELFGAADDSAFLYAFLSRSRARKQAKEQGEHFSSASEEMAYVVGGLLSSKGEVETDHVLAETSAPGEGSATSEQPVEEPLFSPRRSSRFTTRLPRAQRSVSTPAATISLTPSAALSLKRLKDPEFMAKIRENQSISTATRQNTTRNKLGALSVKMRLIQLGAEARVRESEESLRATGEVFNASVGESDAGPNKKRKGVCWGETLATYQDGSEPLKDSLDLEETPTNKPESPLSNEIVKPEPTPDAGADSESTSLGTPADISLQTLVQRLNEKKDKRGGAKKVRELRRLNAGSMNGTPAPKKSTPTTHLPVPVGSQIGDNHFASWGRGSASSSSKSAPGEEGVQTRTRSQNGSKTGLDWSL